MNIKIFPQKLSGTITAIPSKSQAHRLLICAAFSDAPTTLLCKETNQDIEATVSCLNAIGAEITRTNIGYLVNPVYEIPKTAYLDCHESGSTLRFMLPIVCALGIHTTIHMSGRLPHRPLSPMWEELQRMGCTLTKPTDDSIVTSGKLIPGEYRIAGNISSQFISGLLFALSLVDGENSIQVIGKLESEPYVLMTQQVLNLFGVHADNNLVHGNFPFHSPGTVNVEGDWSNAAFFLVASELGNDVTILNLDTTSIQGDRAILDILKMNQFRPVISAANIPDLVPILAVNFAAKNGVIFTDIARLRLKESDRVKSVIDLLSNLGIHAEADENTLIVSSGKFTGGIIDAYGDHRIAMAAGIAATIASKPIVLIGAQCVEKSYPAFWQEYERLGGKYEQYIR